MPTSESKTLRGVGVFDEPLSFSHIKRVTPLTSHLANFLKPFATEDVYRRVWDFDGDAIIDDFWTLDADATATAFAIPATQVLGGALVGSTGTTDNGGFGMLGTPVIRGDNRAYFHAHIKVSAVTDFQIEAGLVNAITDLTLPAVSDIDTPANGSNGATDFALFHIDTDQTLKTAAFVADGATSGMDCTKVNFGTFLPTADTYFCIRIIVDGNDAYAMLNNQRAYYKALTGNIEGGTLLRPWIYGRTRSVSSKNVSVDFVEIAGERA